MNLRNTLSIQNTASILREAIRGEEARLDEYHDALKDRNLPLRMNSLPMKHQHTIHAVISTEKVLEELMC